MADAVLIISKGGNTLLANPAAERLLRGQTGESLDAWRRGFRRFHGDGVTPMAIEDTPISRAMRGESVDLQDIVVIAAGETKPQHLVANSRPIRDAAGAIMGVVAVYRDVTGQKETELLLRQAQKMDAVGQLTGGIAHDFNNILTVITGTIEILAEAVADKPQLAAVAKMIDDAAERGSELTNQLLAFARRQPLQPRTTDVNGLINDMVKLLRPTLGERIEIEAMLASDAWPALVDTAQLNTALLNLAINARDAMPNGGKLTIETRNVMLDDAYAAAHSEVAPGPYTMIALSDTGVGIPAAILDKVFEPFFTTKEIGKGTGLGLSMVYGLVKQSGGHIKIYSEEGHGTTVKIYLPRAGEQSESDPVRVPAALPEGGTETVLVVEDDRLVRENVVAQLRSLGYTTHAAANAAEALKLIERGEPIDLLFTDIVMPGPINGRQLANEALKRRPALKVLFTSGYTENAIVHHGRLDPGVLLLAKPYRKSELAVMVRTAIDAPPIDQAVARSG
jgi:signal transduction histidine kinase/CheY-like chemotaxis protein